MSILMIILCCLLILGTCIYFHDGYHLDRKAKKQITKKVNELDQYGYHKEYDPHLTRDLEEAEGISGKLTQCDDLTCTRCHWKARNKYNVNQYSPTDKYYHRVNSFIDSLPDNLSDAEYDEKLKAFKDAQEIGRAKAAAIEAEKKLKKEMMDRESYYSTPNHLIDQYLQEGRTYSRSGNSWSNPGNSTYTMDDFDKLMSRADTIKRIKAEAKLARETNLRLIEAKMLNQDVVISELEHDMKTYLDGLKVLRKKLKEMQDESNLRIQR